MNDHFVSIMEQHQLELQRVKEEMLLLTQQVSGLDDTASVLYSLTYDTFISYEISNMNLLEDKQSDRLYEEINNAFNDLKKKYEEFSAKQYDIECLHKLTNNDLVF